MAYPESTTYPKLMLHLNHPCREVDLWSVESAGEAEIAKKQGYVDLLVVREVVRVYQSGLKAWLRETAERSSGY